ncbi:MAG TPA: hypothetical protein VMV86_02160 [Methanosarcinales archaeon]|nr:hypothetical protein [Methanosarcinales archaeon]
MHCLTHEGFAFEGETLTQVLDKCRYLSWGFTEDRCLWFKVNGYPLITLYSYYNEEWSDRDMKEDGAKTVVSCLLRDFNGWQIYSKFN